VTAARDHLERDPLRNIALLKMLALYPESAELFATEGGVLLRLPVTASAYDRAAYPGFDDVIFLSSDGREAADLLLGHVPPGRHVFKVMNADDRSAIETRFAVRRHTAFVSYTSSPGARFAPDPRVDTMFSDDELALFERDGYAREWLREMLTNDAARCFARREAGVPISIGLVYRNHGNVWEIGGLFTGEDQRRRGLARSIVETALSTLGERAPRYQVIETNLPSRALATSLGLREFLVTEHLLSA
jgi:hypothetical protein